MKTLLFLFFIVGVAPAFAQSRFAVSAQLAPVYAHADSKITAGGGAPVSEFIINSNGLSYSLGINARYAFSPKWSITTGIWATHVATSKQDVVQDGNSYTVRYEYNHPFSNFYKAPLLINYQSSTKRLSPYFSLGATFDFRGTSYVDLSGNGEYTAVKFGKAVVVTPLVGIGALYNLTKHTALIVQPTLQYDIESRPAYTYYHSYQVSLQAQLLYRF
ncbi:hypothetical protein [Spirosoma gilvum]